MPIPIRGAIDRIQAFIERRPPVEPALDFRRLNEHIRNTGKCENVKDIVSGMAKSMKEIIDHDVVGFALQEGSSLQVWLDPRVCRDSLIGRIQSDFPCNKIDGIYYFDTQAVPKAQRVRVPSRILAGYPFEEGDWRAIAYLILPAGGHGNHAPVREIILESTRLALDNLLKIRKLQKDAAYDHLTGCFNRRALEKCLDHDIAMAQRYGIPLSLIIFDLDHFKCINDSYGHLAGDLVLKEIALLIGKTIRKSDYLARYGGEEFVVCLPNTHLHYAIRLAENMRLLLKKNRLVVDGKAIGLTASFGVVNLRPEMDRRSLLAEADKMLYLAKTTGRDRVSTFKHGEFPAGKRSKPTRGMASQGKMYHLSGN